MNGRSQTAHPLYAPAGMFRAGNPPDAVRLGGVTPLVSWKLWQASPSCFMWLVHFIRLAASRIFWTAGSKRPIRIAMIAITTSSSISVNADRLERGRDMAPPERKEERDKDQGPTGADCRHFNRIGSRSFFPGLTVTLMVERFGSPYRPNNLSSGSSRFSDGQVMMTV